ncbi:hypothetical protein M9458_051633, partial [Cirrhinus mrigala]
LQQFYTFTDYLNALIQPSAESCPSIATAKDYKEAEISAHRQIQAESFPDEVFHSKSGKTLPPNSRLLCLAPELDISTNLIRVGGRLRQINSLEEDNIHPIVLDPHHPLTKLIIKDFDDCLHHPEPERVFSELRRKYWILRTSSCQTSSAPVHTMPEMVGRRNEKRLGIIFKCMTTCAVHIDLLASLDSDSFLMALRRFIAR